MSLVRARCYDGETLPAAPGFPMSAPLTAEDRGFIRAILDHPEEFTTWLAYADWLDDRGDPRAEFLRLAVARKQSAAGDPGVKALDERLAVLRGELDPNWMLVFDTPRVENCRLTGWRFVCPKTWDQLSPTDEPDIRICHDCKSPVFFCQTPEEARVFASCGQCVALSTRVPEAENPFADEEGEGVADMGEYDFLDSDEYPALPPADPPAAPEPAPPSPRRPWWKFW